MLFTRSKGRDLDVKRKRCESMDSRLDDYKLIILSRLAIHDQTCVLYGGTVPFGVREQGKGYDLNGEGYLHGLMNGEM